jgi:hypothetical protein
MAKEDKKHGPGHGRRVAGCREKRVLEKKQLKRDAKAGLVRKKPQ